MTQTVQELESALKNAPDEQTRIDALNALAMALIPSDELRARSLAEDARRRATSGEYQAQPYQEGLADSLCLLGQLQCRLGEHETATRLLVEAVALYKEVGNQQRNVSLVQEISLRKQAEAELQKGLEQIMIVLQVYDEVNRTLNVDYVQLIALDAAHRLSKADAGFIALSTGDQIRVSRAIGPYPPQDQQAILNPDHPVLKRIIGARKAEIFQDDLASTADALPTLPNTQARIILPMNSRERFLGLVNLETSKPERFDENAFQLLRILEQYLSIALDNAQLYEQVHDQLDEMQELYQQVSQLEQLKTDMIRVAAHDLRNPLTAINGTLKLLELDRDEFDPVYHEYFDAIRHAATRMKTILEDILSLERIEQMAQIKSSESFDVSEQVKRAVAEYQNQAAQKSQQLRAKIETETVPLVRGDPPQIYEAISNLISNAIKYTPEKGIVQVLLKADANHVVFEVSDTGYGIPEELQERLFQPFYRAKTRETEDIDGTGLGLHLVKNIVARHDGEMIFQSAHGKGSTFGFILPRN